MEDSDGLWEKHCKREFRGHERQDELETWRELYWVSRKDVWASEKVASDLGLGSGFRYLTNFVFGT